MWAQAYAAPRTIARVASPAPAGLCDPTHGGLAAARLDWRRMEWILQVVDEFDDGIGAVRLWCLGVGAEIGLAAAGVLGMGAIGAAIVTGAEVPLICCAAIVLSLGAALKVHGWQLQPGSLSD
jgi:hypothetical protein